MKRLTAAVLIGLAVFLIIGLTPVHGEDEIYDTVVRLHVLANSDSEEDQARKLSVRDAILEVTAPLMEGCRSRADAEEILNAHTDELLEAARNVLDASGCDDPVTILLGEESYPERSYDSFCFPAGTYLSLRVAIGDAEGHNWWCCLFPPLCKAAASVSSGEAEDAFLSVGLTPSQYRIVTESDSTVYKIRFKILELFRR